MVEVQFLIIHDDNFLSKFTELQVGFPGSFGGLGAHLTEPLILEGKRIILRLIELQFLLINAEHTHGQIPTPINSLRTPPINEYFGLQISNSLLIFVTLFGQ